MKRRTARNWWSFVLFGLLAFVLLIIGIAGLHGDDKYTPLTLEQAERYIQANPEGAARDIMKLDAIEHTAPRVDVPAFLLVLSGRDAVWSWQAPMVVTLAGEPPTAYDVELRGGEQKGFAPADQHANVVFWEVVAGAALVAGALLGRAFR